MPEGLFPVPEMVVVAKQKIQAGEIMRASDDVEEKIAPKYPETEFIGSGTERVVVGHPTDPEKVVGYQYKEYSENPVRFLEIYHFHRFFATLFPHNFPHIFASFAGEDPFTVKTEQHAADAEIIYSFKEVKEICHKLRIDLVADTSKGNFIVNENGEEHYVDALGNFNSSEIFWKEFKPKKLEQYLKTHNFSEKDKRLIWSSLERLKELELISTITYLMINPDEDLIPKKWRTKLPEFWVWLCEQKGFTKRNKAKRPAQERIIRTAELLYARSGWNVLE